MPRCLVVRGIDHHETVLVNTTVLRDGSTEAATGTSAQTVASRTPKVETPRPPTVEPSDGGCPGVPISVLSPSSPPDAAVAGALATAAEPTDPTRLAGDGDEASEG